MSCAHVANPRPRYDNRPRPRAPGGLGEKLADSAAAPVGCAISSTFLALRTTASLTTCSLQIVVMKILLDKHSRSAGKRAQARASARKRKAALESNARRQFVDGIRAALILSSSARPRSSALVPGAAESPFSAHSRAEATSPNAL